jgi:hypothetical protein
MPRRPCTFKKTDITRATKAVLDAGLEVDRIEIRDGMIALFPCKPEGPTSREPERTEWDSAV